MPVQINEIIIRTVVDPPPVAGSGQSSQGSSGNNPPVDYETIEKVLEIIKEKQER